MSPPNNALANSVPRFELTGWLLFTLSAPLWVAALWLGEASLRALALVVYIAGSLVIVCVLPRRHSSPFHVGLAALAAAHAVTLPFVVSRPGLEPIVLDFYGWAWFLYSCFHAALTLFFMSATRLALAFLDPARLDRYQNKLKILWWGLAGSTAASLGVIATGFGVAGIAPENAFGLVWPLSVIPVSLTVILALWLKRTEQIGWLLVLYSILYWILALQYQLSDWRLLALVYHALGLGLLWWPRLRASTSAGQRGLQQLAVIWSFLLLLAAFDSGQVPEALHYYGRVPAFLLGFQMLCVLLFMGVTYYKSDGFEHILLNLGPSQVKKAFGFIILAVILCIATATVMVLSGILPLEAVTYLLAIDISLLLLAAVIVTYYGNPDDFIWSPQRRALVLAIISVFSLAGIVLSFVSLKTFPNFMTTDEPWVVSFNDTLDRTGKLYASINPTEPIPSLSAPRIYLVSNIWMNLWDRGIYTARSFSVIGGLALLVIVFAIARELYDTQTGLIVLLLTATNLLWVAVSHVMRSEMWFTAAIWLAFLLALVARRRQSGWLAGLSGLVIALSSEIHSAGPLFCVILGVWWLSDWKTVRSERRMLGMFIAGGLLGALFYASYHIFPDPAAYWHDIQNQMTGQGGGQLTPWGVVIERHRPYYQANKIELIGLLIGSLVAMIRLPEVRRTGLFVILIVGAYFLLQSDPNIYYSMLWFTGLIILTACVLRSLPWQWLVPMLVILVGSFGLNALLIREHIIEDWNNQGLEVIDQVVERLPEKGTVLAHPVFYFSLRDPGLVSYAYVETLEPDFDKQWPVIDRINPMYIIGAPLHIARPPQAHTLSFFPIMNMPITSWCPGLAFRYKVVDVVYTDMGIFQIWQRRDTLSN